MRNRGSKKESEHSDPFFQKDLHIKFGIANQIGALCLYYAKCKQRTLISLVMPNLMSLFEKNGHYALTLSYCLYANLIISLFKLDSFSGVFGVPTYFLKNFFFSLLFFSGT